MIRTRLMEHQNRVVSFCKPLDYAGIFADYGTGKTLCALMLAEVKKYRKVLVVSTVLAIDTTWVDEIRGHTDYKFCILRGTAKQKVNLLNYALAKVNNPRRYHETNTISPLIVLLNYESVKSLAYELSHGGFDAIVADESTAIKTFDSLRTLAAQEVGQHIPNRYIMTGFPVTEALNEIYSQIKFLDGGKAFGNSYYAFLNRYFVRHGPRTIVKKKAIQQIMSAIAPFCIIVDNKALKLPPKRYKQVLLEPTTLQKELLQQLNDTYKLEHGSVKIDTQYIFALIEKSLEICDGFIRHVEREVDPETDKKTGKVISEEIEFFDTPKDEALLEILEDIDVRKNKVVIWCAFLPSILKVERILRKAYRGSGVELLTIKGNDRDTNKTVQMFQKTKNCNILLCTQKKAAASVTLTAAQYSMYYSNVASNDLRSNSEARTRRKGSEVHDWILYIDFVLKNTREQLLIECLKKKKNFIAEVKAEFEKVMKR
jgi:SNF2 family DNA or RNA helicase